MALRAKLNRSILIIGYTIGFFTVVTAQELNCEVIVNMEQISSANTDYVKNLKPDLEQYINDHEWTDNRFNERERINCTLQFDLTSIDDNSNISGSLVISTRRPIYGSTQQTQVVILRDNTWSINYPINKTLVHDLQVFDSLTSLIDYYVFVMLGYDYDTFSPLGGTKFFEEALRIVDIAQNAQSVGWSRSSGTSRDNRFFLVNLLLNSNYAGLRQVYYRYHRHGLDKFLISPEESRKEILAQLENLRDTRLSTTEQFIFNIFFDAKYREIISIYEDAETVRRMKAHALLTEIDQSHINSYDAGLLN